MPKATSAGASDMVAERADAVRELGPDATPEQIDEQVQQQIDDRDGVTERGDRTLATGERGDEPALRNAEQAHRDAELVRDSAGNVVGSSHPADRVDGQPDAAERAARGDTDDDVLRENGHDVPPAANSDAGKAAAAADDPDAFDPDTHTVAEVNAYLAELGEDDDRTVDEVDAERERVLAAERGGQSRKGIVGE